MFALPQVTKGEVCLGFASWNEVWLDEPPRLLAIRRELGKEEACVLDVDVVTPRGQFHGEELMRRQRTYQKRRFVDEDIAEREAVDVSLGSVVQPVLGEVERPRHSPNCTADEGRVDMAQDENVNVFCCLARSIQEHHGGATDDHDLAASGQICELARERQKSASDVVTREHGGSLPRRAAECTGSADGNVEPTASVRALRCRLPPMTEPAAKLSVGPR